MKEPRNPQANKPPIITSSCGKHALLRHEKFPPPPRSSLYQDRLPVRQPSEVEEEESYVEACRESRDLASYTTQPSEEWRALQSFKTLRLTKDEEQRQFLLQVVEAHRHQQPGTSKASLPRPSRPQ
ncbi:hypothetical protein GWK47_039349 [Chionoecetes opilio]|uniref:Uncharacterized protein n=1 Tax=Chionoecetes opilio TaxID=41210 RepID=A0A8J5D0F3_CHIOP|nr:hypothetical protein GWK47_039349 [Chionoecetes opilio]